MDTREIEERGVRRLRAFVKLQARLTLAPEQIMVLEWTPRIRFKIFHQEPQYCGVMLPYPEYKEDLKYESIVSQECKTPIDRGEYRRGWGGFGQPLTDAQAVSMHIHVQRQMVCKYECSKQKNSLLGYVLQRVQLKHIKSFDAVREKIIGDKDIMMKDYSTKVSRLKQLEVKRTLDVVTSYIARDIEKADNLLAGQEGSMKSLRTLEFACWNTCWNVLDTVNRILDISPESSSPESQQLELAMKLLFTWSKLERTITLFEHYFCEAQLKDPRNSTHSSDEYSITEI